MHLPIAEVEARRHAALVAMTEAAGGAALCALSRAGQSVPAVKYREGAAAALGIVRRRLLSGETDCSVIDSVSRSWEATPEHTADWSAYRLGGLDALADVMSGCPADSANPPSGRAGIPAAG